MDKAPERIRTWTKCRTVVETLSDEIMSGRYNAPATFPSTARIVRRFNVAHLTAVRAVDQLKKLGLVRSRRGSCTYVSPTAGKGIGLMVPSWSGSDFFPALCSEVSGLCQKMCRPLFFADTARLSPDGIADRLEDLARSFVEQRVSGVLFHPVDFCASARTANARVVAKFREAGIPVVLHDCDIVDPPEESGFDVVGIDNVAAGRKLGDHVLSQGARRIVYASVFPKLSPNVQSRLSGLRDAVSATRGAKLAEFDMSTTASGKLLGECLRKTKADAIVCSSDRVAALAIREILALGIRVPQDVIVSGVNDITVATMVTPALTTIHQPCADIARVAFETLERRRADPDAPAMRVFLPAPLVVRESTAGERKATSRRRNSI